MKKYLYFNYFREKNPDRFKEYQLCLQKNFALDWVDGYKIFLEDADHAADLPQDPRIEYVVQSRRMEFRDAIDHAHQTLEDNNVVIIINLDVYLNGPHWATIDRDFFQKGHAKKAMVCTRLNLTGNSTEQGPALQIEAENWYKGDFCDAYVMSTPFDPDFLKEDLSFCVGHAAQCDNLMMYLLRRYNHVYSWGARYQIIHVDICRALDWQGKLRANVKTADDRAKARQYEHINIPTQQPWQQLLERGEAPICTWTWFDFKRTL